MDPDFKARLDALAARGTAADPAADDHGWMLQRARERCERLIPAEYRTAEPTHPDVIEWARTFRAGADLRQGLLLLGPVGVGKTWEAYGALKNAVTAVRPIRWEAESAADLIDALRPRPGTDSSILFRRYASAHLLLLDDLGIAKSSEWVEELTFRLVDYRYRQGLATIATSNLSPADLAAILGERVVSRFAQRYTRVVLKGHDRRRSK